MSALRSQPLPKPLKSVVKGFNRFLKYEERQNLKKTKTASFDDNDINNMNIFEKLASIDPFIFDSPEETMYKIAVGDPTNQAQQNALKRRAQIVQGYADKGRKAAEEQNGGKPVSSFSAHVGGLNSDGTEKKTTVSKINGKDVSSGQSKASQPTQKADNSTGRGTSQTPGTSNTASKRDPNIDKTVNNAGSAKKREYSDYSGMSAKERRAAQRDDRKQTKADLKAGKITKEEAAAQKQQRQDGKRRNQANLKQNKMIEKNNPGMNASKAQGNSQQGQNAAAKTKAPMSTGDKKMESNYNKPVEQKKHTQTAAEKQAPAGQGSNKPVEFQKSQHSSASADRAHNAMSTNSQQMTNKANAPKASGLAGTGAQATKSMKMNQPSVQKAISNTKSIDHDGMVD